MTELTEIQNMYLGYVISGANRLLGVINQLLDLSKIEAGKMALSLCTFSIGDLIQERVSIFKTLTRDKPIIFEIVFGNDLPDFLIGDPQHLDHILSNLLANAIKFTESGRITIAVKEVGKNEKSITLKFMVTDPGIGIPEDKLNLLFCKFSQIDSSTTRKYGGTGLGLAISKDLVELMGGEIGVQSEPGKGSSFYFTITFDLPPRQ
jgi:signal transduction histidine kinase